MHNLILTLKHLIQDAAVAPDPEVRIRGIVSQVKAAMEVAVCSLYLSDEIGVLTLAATDGLNPDSVGKIQLTPGDGLVGQIAATQHPLNVESASQDPHFHYFPETGEERYEAFLGAPVVHDGDLVGVLVVEQEERRKFTEEEESFLITVAAHLGATDPTGYQPERESGDGGIDVTQATRRLKGIKGAPGIGIGRILLLSDAADLMTVPDAETDNVDAELETFRAAVKATLEDLAESRQKVAENVPGEVAEIFTIYKMLLEGASFSGAVEKAIASGKAAAPALRAVVLEFAERFEEADDDYLRARGEDIRNLGSRVYGRLRKTSPSEIAEGEPIVLVGGLVSIADIAAHPVERLAGIVSMEGSVLSHTAVLAKALGLPAVMGVGHTGEIPNQALMIVDGFHGQALLNPAPQVVAEFRRLMNIERSLADELSDLKTLPAETSDGFRVHLYANTGLLADITPGLTHGAEGIGLYRSEIPFIAHGSFPSEDEQVEVYREVIRAYPGMPIHIRTLDIGGDKPLPYFPFQEENPALGWRGVRFTLDHSAILMTQIRAILRAAEDHDHLHIILPMVTAVAEIETFSKLLDSACDQLDEEGFRIRRPKLGIMVEVPASIAILPFLAGKIDFLSIGSNDLTQYLLAVDRNNVRVAKLFDHLHPAILQAIETILAHAKALGIPASICGEMAADPCATVLLLGMGINSLSMSATSIPRIKWLIRTLSRKEAQGELTTAKGCPDPTKIRSRLNDFLVKRGLGRLLEPEDVILKK